MTLKQLLIFWDAGVGFTDMGRLMLLRYLVRTGTISEGVPSTAFQRPEPYDDTWETVKHNEPRLGYRD